MVRNKRHLRVLQPILPRNNDLRKGFSSPAPYNPARSSNFLSPRLLIGRLANQHESRAAGRPVNHALLPSLPLFGAAPLSPSTTYETTYSDVYKSDLPLLPVTPQVVVTGFIFVRHPRTSLGLARPRQKHGPSHLRHDR